MLATLRDLVAHKGHANAALLNAVRRTDAAAADRELWDLLHHILLANRFWLLSILRAAVRARRRSARVRLVRRPGRPIRRSAGSGGALARRRHRRRSCADARGPADSRTVRVRWRRRFSRSACTRTAIGRRAPSCCGATAACRHRPTSSCGSRPGRAPTGPTRQPSRSTRAGSMRAARLAGSQPASIPTISSAAAAPSSVAGSRGSSS